MLWFFQVIATAGKDLFARCQVRPITAAFPTFGGTVNSEVGTF